MSTTTLFRPPTASTTTTPTIADPAPVVTAVDATVDLRDGTRVLHAVNVEIRPGALVVVVGASGSGKTTLLETLAGVRVPTSGTIDAGARPMAVGYVPQDDIVHRELSVEATVRYAARLRLPSGTSAGELDRTVTRTLDLLGLTDRRTVAVGSLSGGQRKRASIATELVVQPSVCFLDEPTAGLDPLAAAALMDVVRGLADSGTAIAMTTHNLADLRVADRLIVVADGRIVFDGAPDEGVHLLGVPDLGGRLHAPATPADDMGPPAIDPPRAEASAATRTRSAPRSTRRPRREQTRVLARRNGELMTRNRMSLAIMAGSPLLVVAMFAVLFPSDAFSVTSPDPTAATAIAYWLAFAGFFFGLTFGLLQICTELAIVRRERLVTIDIGPYLLAKAAVLAPALAVVNGAMLAALVWLDRLPGLGLDETVTLLVVLLLDSLAGLALGLLASAAVASAAQAALALPMLCFPAVLFSGAVLPVRSMTPVGRAIAMLTSDRWGFEAVARSLGLGDAGSATARRVADVHGAALSGSIGSHLAVMAVAAVVCAVAAWFVLDRRTR